MQTAFNYFDKSKHDHLKSSDIETMLMSLGTNVSVSYFRALTSKFMEGEKFMHGKLTDIEKEETVN